VCDLSLFLSLALPSLCLSLIYITTPKLHAEMDTKRKGIGYACLDTLKRLTSKNSVLAVHREKHGLSYERAEKIWTMYLEYMTIKARWMDYRSEMKFSTSPEVDELWHTHLLNTESYHELMELIREINPMVKFIHHSEKNAEDPDDVKEARRKAAAEAYQETFRKECQWFEEEQSATDSDADASDDDGELWDYIFVDILTHTGRKFDVRINVNRTVGFLKRLIQDKEGIPVDQQRLIFRGAQLLDSPALKDYNIQRDCVDPPLIHLVLRLRGC